MFRAARTVANKCNPGSRRRLSPGLWEPHWDFLPPGSRGLVLGDQVSRPVVTAQGGQSSHATGVLGTVHSLRHASRDRVTHLGSRPLGGALAAAGRGRRRWLWLRLLLSLCPARPWGWTWPGSGHPPARCHLSSRATPSGLNRRPRPALQVEEATSHHPTWFPLGVSEPVLSLPGLPTVNEQNRPP